MEVNRPSTTVLSPLPRRQESLAVSSRLSQGTLAEAPNDTFTPSQSVSQPLAYSTAYSTRRMIVPKGVASPLNVPAHWGQHTLKFGSASAPDLICQPKTPFTVAPITEIQRDTATFLPESIPAFILHGTWQDSTSIDSWIESFNPGRRRVYQAYIPETQYATGILKTGKPEDIPGILSVYQDVGQFRTQMLHLQLEDLGPWIDGTSDLPPPCLSRIVMDDFKPTAFPALWNALRDALRQTLFDHPVLPLPRRDGTTLPQQVAQSVEEIREQAATLASYFPETLQPTLTPIIDSGWFFKHFEALQVLRAENGNNHTPAPITIADIGVSSNSHLPIIDWAIPEIWRRTSHSQQALPKLITPRIVDQALLHRIDERVDATEAAIAKALTPVIQQHTHWDKPASQEMATHFAGAIRQWIYPNILTLGYSLGGTALVTALLKYQRDHHTPDNSSSPPMDIAANGINDEGYIEQGGGLGMVTAVSAPLTGIPRIPAWADAFVGSLPRPLKRPTIATVWNRLEHNKYGITESRAGSELMGQIQDSLHSLEGSGHTVVSLINLRDTFIEPDAARLPHITDMDNVFNLPLHVPAIPIPGKEDLLDKYIRPNLGNRVIQTLNRFHDKIYELYIRFFSSQFQHGAILSHPQFLISQGLFNKIVEQPELVSKLIAPANFEPLRTSLTRCVINHLEAQPTGESLARLMTQYDPVLPQLITVASTPSLTSYSPAHAALTLLDRWSVWAEELMNPDPTLKPSVHLSQQQAETLTQQLQQIAAARLPAQNGLTPSQHAYGTLRRLGLPQIDTAPSPSLPWHVAWRQRLEGWFTPLLRRLKESRSLDTV